MAAISSLLQDESRVAAAPPKKARRRRPPGGTRCSNFWSAKVHACRSVGVWYSAASGFGPPDSETGASGAEALR